MAILKLAVIAVPPEGGSNGNPGSNQSVETARSSIWLAVEVCKRFAMGSSSKYENTAGPALTKTITSISSRASQYAEGASSIAGAPHVGVIEQSVQTGQEQVWLAPEVCRRFALTGQFF